MNLPRGQSSEEEYPPLAVVHGTGEEWIDPPIIMGTGGGTGGGDSLDKRVTILETHVGHIQADIVTIKDDIRDMRNIGIGSVLVVFAALIGLYIYIGTEAKELDDKFDELNIAVTRDIGNINTELSSVKTQNTRIINDIGNLQSSLDSLIKE